MISSAYLFFVDSRDSNPDFRKDWWIVYFTDPKNSSLDFVIENHSDKNYFNYDIFDGNNRVSGGGVIIGKGETKIIALDEKLGQIENKKITIRVSDGLELKEIYKNFKD